MSIFQKNRYVTLEWSLNNTTTLGMNHICFISLSITHIDDNIIEEVIVDIWRRDLAMLSDLNETQPFPRTLCH